MAIRIVSEDHYNAQVREKVFGVMSQVAEEIDAWQDTIPVSELSDSPPNWAAFIHRLHSCYTHAVPAQHNATMARQLTQQIRHLWEYVTTHMKKEIATNG